MKKDFLFFATPIFLVTLTTFVGNAVYARTEENALQQAAEQLTIREQNTALTELRTRFEATQIEPHEVQIRVDSAEQDAAKAARAAEQAAEAKALAAAQEAAQKAQTAAEQAAADAALAAEQARQDALIQAQLDQIAAEQAAADAAAAKKASRKSRAS